MSRPYFTLFMLAASLGSFAQHGQHVPAPSDAPPFDPKRSSFPEVKTDLPFSRPLAAAQAKPTGKRVEYDLVIDERPVNITGKPTRGITLNGTIPGPTLRFTEGDVAVIRVHNRLNVETSLHWHGILLPNGQDGVSYLNTPPIKARSTHTFEYPLVQSGTYWFHSHTRFQEQMGVYGSMVIQPQKTTHRVDGEAVLVLSDWTNENPAYILKNLKRRNEWYAVKKGTAQSLDRILANRALGAYLKQSATRMPPMDLSDVYYERFLINGKDTTRFPEFKPGQTIRLRVINAGASTYFHLNFAGGPMRLIAADGLDVQPVNVDRRLIAIAETYDFLITLPASGAYEVRATAQDGSGHATAWLGSGKLVRAQAIPRPNLFALTKSMNSMGQMASGKLKLNGPDTTSQGVILARNARDLVAKGGGMAAMGLGGMDMSMSGMSMRGMNHGKTAPAKPGTKNNREKAAPQRKEMPMAGHEMHDMADMDTEKKMPPPASDKKGQGHDMAGMQPAKAPEPPPAAQHKGHDMGAMTQQAGKNSGDGMAMPGMGHMNMMGEYNTIDYSILRSPLKTTLPADRPVREVPLILSGNMYRYIWGFNGRTLSRADNILIRRGEVVRFRFINQTMMLHPLHLHGHFFRVLNGQGDYSPLKHTVNVSPMETVVIEFLADEEKDWFFHCHLLYHMLTGMARVVSYGDAPDSAIAAIQKLHMRDMRDNQWFYWGYVEAGYPVNYFDFNLSNNRNAIVAGGDHDWRTNSFEVDLDYERYFGDWFRVFAGVDAGNEGFLRRVKGSSDPQTPADGDRKILRPVAGIRYVLPFMIDSEVKVDTRGNVRFQLSGQQALLPRLELQFQAQWLIGGYTRAHLDLQYTLTKNLFLTGDYDTRYRTVAGGIGYNF